MIARTLDIAAPPPASVRTRSIAVLLRPTAVIVLIAAITAPLLLQPWVSSDGIGHYAYVRSLLFDHDLDFANEFEHYNKVFALYGPPTLAGIRTLPSHPVNLNPVIESPIRTSTGRIWNPWPVGSSMLWAPFVLATWPIGEALRALASPLPNDGYGTPYALAVGLGTVVYGVLGMLLCLRLCSRYVSESSALVAVLTTWFGTTFAYYLFVMPSYAHVNSMFAVTWFVWYWHRRFHAPRVAPGAGPAFLLGLIGGLMTAVQWTNVTFLVTFGALAAWSAWASARPGEGIRNLLRYGVPLTAGWLLAFSPQLAANQILYGGLLANPQPVGFFDQLTTPHILGVLFSSDRGLFFWTPLVVACLAGLAFCPKESRPLAGLLLLNFLLHLYVNASVDTWSGDSAFGQRRFTNQTLLFVLGLAALLQRLEASRGPGAAPWVRSLRVVLPASFVAWNLLLVVQYALGIAPHAGPFPAADLLWGQIEALRQMGTVVRFLL